MSNEAINWALTRQIKHSTAKFVLVVMANCADAQDWLAWPSVAHLSEATGQDRKTVIENIKRLISMGFITDTGERKGSTKQVPIYRLNESENGTVKESQKRDSSENGTVPKFPTNSTEIPYKESRFSSVTVPKTGHGTQKEPSRKPKEPKNTDAPPKFVLPSWVPVDAWTGYLEMRKKKNKVPTDRARDLVLADLEQFRAAGHDLAAVLDKSTMNGWTSVYAPKAPEARGSPPGFQTANEKAKEWADRLTGRHRNEPDRNFDIIDINERPA